MKYLNLIIKWILAILMIAVTILTSYQVFMRFVVNNASSWSEELTRLLFVWASFLAAGIGIKEHVHVGIDVVVGLLPKGVQKWISVAVNAAIAAFGGWLSYGCLELMKKTTKQFSAALHYPRPLIYAAIFVFGILCVIYAVQEIILILKGKGGKEK